MRAGRLNRRVTLQRYTNERDERNNVVPVWMDVATVWGRKEDLSVRELEAARTIHADISARFLMRFRSDVALGMRLVVLPTGEIYTVLGAMDRKGNRDELQVLCATGLIDVES